jgi:hypothetical protein
LSNQKGETLRARDSERIKSESDFIFFTKSVTSQATGDLVLELIGGTARGAMINVWERNEPGNLDHIWTPSDDHTWRKLGEVHFMHFENGQAEWDELTSVSAVLSLLERAG